MSTGVSTSTDKIIVDKSRSHRNKAVSKAVRQTRERLQSGHSSRSAFDRDTLRMYAAAALQGATVMPLFVVIIAALGIYFTGNAQILLWALVTLVCHAGNILLVRRVGKQEITAENARGWRRRCSPASSPSAVAGPSSRCRAAPPAIRLASRSTRARRC
jgi:two-component system cell cycle sensor histidine kinase PleC